MVRLIAFGFLFLLIGAMAPVQAETLTQSANIQTQSGNIQVGYPWARTSDGAVAVYMTLADVGSVGGRLLNAATPVAARARLSRASINGGSEKRHSLDAIAIPPGGTLLFRPGGLFVHLSGLKAPLAKGETFPLTLYFADGARSTIDIPIAN